MVLFQGQKPNRMSSNSSKYQHFRLECTLKKRLTEGVLERFYEKFRFHSIPEGQRKRFQAKNDFPDFGANVSFLPDPLTHVDLLKAVHVFGNNSTLQCILFFYCPVIRNGLQRCER